MTTSANALLGNRYRVQNKLGAGGMGTVYRALDQLTGEEVALKRVLISPLTFDSATNATDDMRVGLSREFQILASLRHPNVISVKDHGFDAERQPFFTMNLLEDAQPITLACRTQPTATKVRLLIEMLQALAYVHRRGIIHRDLKPRNVLVDNNGRVQVLDFGLAISHGQEQEVAGTLAYIAPEVLSGESATFAADLYAVGVIAYEMLVGKHPFDIRNITTLSYEILNKQPDLSLLKNVRIEDVVHPPTKTARRSDSEIDPLSSEETRCGEESISQVKSDLPAFTSAPVAALDDDQSTLIGTTDLMKAAPANPAMQAASLDGIAGVIGCLLDKNPANRYPDADTTIRMLCSAFGLPIPVESEEIRESFLQASAFVGRDLELRTLKQELSKAMTGSGSAWLIGGESGVGKSRLLDELRIFALTHGALVLRGQAAAGGVPYQMWGSVLRRLALITSMSDLEAGVLKDIIPDLDTLLGRTVPPAPPLEGRIAQQRLALTISDIVRRQTQPIVLLLEDLQWAGDSLDPLKQIAQATDQLPFLILASYRDDEGPDIPAKLPSMRVMRLNRLDERGIADLSAAMLGDAGRQPQIVELLTRETEGNSFFMVEVVRALAEEAGALNAVGKGQLPESILAGGVQQVLMRRLNRVPEWCREALRLAAIYGRQIDMNIMRATGLALDWEAWLTVCANAAVIDNADGVWRFAHDKLRETLLTNDFSQSTALIRIRGLHRIIGQALETVYSKDPNYTDALAEHWFIAGDTPKAIRYAIAAAERLLVTTADVNRIQAIIERVLPIADEKTYTPQRATLLRLLGDLSERSSQYDQARKHYEASIKLGGTDPKILTAALNGLSVAAWRTGDYITGQTHADRALVIAEAIHDMKNAGLARGHLGVIALQSGDLPKAREHLLQSLALRQASGEQRGIASCFNNLGIIEKELGNNPAAIEYFSQSLDFYRAIGDRSGLSSVLNNLGLLYADMHQFQQAQLYYEESLTIRKQTGDRRGAGLALNNLGELAMMQQQYDQALAYMQSSLAISREVNDRRSISLVLVNLGLLAAQQHDLDTAQQYFNESLQTSQEIHDLRGVCVSMNGIAQCQIERGEFALARAKLAQAILIGLPLGLPLVMDSLMLLAHIYARENQPEKAARLIGLVHSHPASRETSRKEAQEIYDRNLTKSDAALKIVDQARASVDDAAWVQSVIDDELLQLERIKGIGDEV